jgi:hypothetical protein
MEETSLVGHQETKTDATTRGRSRCLPTSRPAVIGGGGYEGWSPQSLSGEPAELGRLRVTSCCRACGRHAGHDDARRTHLAKGELAESSKAEHRLPPICTLPQERILCLRRARAAIRRPAQFVVQGPSTVARAVLQTPAITAASPSHGTAQGLRPPREAIAPVAPHRPLAGVCKEPSASWEAWAGTAHPACHRSFGARVRWSLPRTRRSAP